MTSATRHRVTAARFVAAGAVSGLAWASSLRGFMADAAGADSAFSWFGTFGAILLPGAAVGALLGWAEVLRRRDHPRARLLALSPLVFAVLDPVALIVVLPAMAGGLVLAGRGSRPARWIAAPLALLPVPGYVLAVIFLDDAGRLATPRGVWTAVLLFSLLAVLTVASAIPHRASDHPVP